MLLLEKDGRFLSPALCAHLGDVVMQGDGCDPLTLKGGPVSSAPTSSSRRRAKTPITW